MQYPLHKDSDGRWVHTWVRQSSVKTSDMCMERFRNDIYGVHDEVQKDAAALGTACHAAAEDALYAKRNGTEFKYQDVIDAFRYHWHEVEEPAIQEWSSYTPEKAADAGAERIGFWWSDVYPELQPKLIEHTFSKVLIEDDERVVHLTGTIDLVEDGRLWDWKFPKRDYAKDAWQYQRWDIQSIAYCYAMDIPDFSYAIMHPKGVGRIDLVRDESHFDWLSQKVLALCRYVENAPAAPWVLGDNGWWCSEKWCPSWTQCKGSHIKGA